MKPSILPLIRPLYPHDLTAEASLTLTLQHETIMSVNQLSGLRQSVMELIDRIIEDQPTSVGFRQMLEAFGFQQPAPSLPTREWLGGMYAPASRSRHHSFPGGLNYHMVEMWNLWVTTLRPVLLEPLKVEISRWMNSTPDQEVLVGILMHDAHKMYLEYSVDSTEFESYVGLLSIRPEHGEVNDRKFMLDHWRNMVKNRYDLSKTHKGVVEDRMTKNERTLLMLMRAGVPMNELRMNVLSCSEGGYSPNAERVQPTALAKLVYLLDELSANVVCRLTEA